MAQVVAFVDDLFFQAKLSGNPKQLGIELRTCTTPAALASEIAERPPRLVVVDLNARGNPLQAIENTRATAPDIPVRSAFFPTCRWNSRSRRRARPAARK